MFKIIIILFIINIVNAKEVDLIITKEGIYSNSEKKLVYKQNLKNESLSIYSIENIPTAGESLVYESMNIYKKQCYIPISKINNDYYIFYKNCIEINISNISNDVKPSVTWIAESKYIGKTLLNEMQLDKLLDMESKSILKIKPFIHNAYMYFYKLPIYKNNKLIYTEHKFKIFETGNLPMIDLSDMVIKPYTKTTL